MLSKLMKHEFRATSRVMLPMFLLVLATSVGANLSARTLTEMENRFLNLLGMMLGLAFVVAIVGVCIVAFALMIQRFYKNLLQDEGYVMLTLPVSVAEHIGAKLLVSMAWYVATGVVLAAACVILVYDVGVLDQLIRGFGELLSALRFGEEFVSATAFIVELLALMFFGGASACLQFYAALAIGHSFANHKMLLSVAVYFGGQFAFQLLGGGFLILMSYTKLDYTLTQLLPRLSGAAAVHVLMVAAIALSILFAAVFYFLTLYFMKKRLNLE